MEIKQLLGLDVGKVRTGVARASSAAAIAEPLTTLQNKEDIYTKLRNIVEEQNIDMIVVGLPRALSGRETEQTAWTRQWVDKAKKHVDLPFYWQDESLTSKLAEKVHQIPGKAKGHSQDALAAVIILQDFLDSPEAEWTLC